MQQNVQEHVTDSLTTITIGSWVLTFADVNVVLETFTLTLGVVAGAFAIYFHVRRYLRQKHEVARRQENDRRIEQILDRLPEKYDSE